MYPKKLLCLVLLALNLASLAAADLPRTEITNGLVRATVYLPNPTNGFYRGVRFDRSGILANLEYAGHTLYAPWFDRVDPKVPDFAWMGEELAAGPGSAVTGPAEEFLSDGAALGWGEAEPGDTFIKIGVGVLRKDNEPYSFARPYEMVDPGVWTVDSQPEAVEFTHRVADPSSGYAYAYRKTVRLKPGKPELVLEHRLENTGRRVLRSSVYNHNFLTVDRLPVGPDFLISLPYAVQDDSSLNTNLVTRHENQIRFAKALEPGDVARGPLRGPDDSARLYELRVENTAAGVGVRIVGDRPLRHAVLWAIRRVVAVEPFIEMTIEPGRDFTWTIAYEFYTLPSIGKADQPGGDPEARP